MSEMQTPNEAPLSPQAEAELRAALMAALEWQIEAGADEAIGEAPIDRTAPPEPSADAPRRGAGARAPQVGAAPSTPPAAEDPGADAREAAAAAPDLAALEAAMQAFEGSSLKAGARRCVFADGRPGAPLMVIGEGPGVEEDKIGKPFVGRSGQLLDRMLGAIGLSRQAEALEQAVYIANLVPWRPLRNRTPDDQEVAVLAPFLKRHIALAKPKMLLCLGGAPAKHLMGAPVGVMRYRGAWIDYPAEGGAIPCLSTVHPAYLLRNPEMKRLAWRDLLALREKLDAITGAGPREPNP